MNSMSNIYNIIYLALNFNQHKVVGNFEITNVHYETNENAIIFYNVKTNEEHISYLTKLPILKNYLMNYSKNYVDDSEIYKITHLMLADLEELCNQQ